MDIPREALRLVDRDGRISLMTSSSSIDKLTTCKPGWCFKPVVETGSLRLFIKARAPSSGLVPITLVQYYVRKYQPEYLMKTVAFMAGSH